MQEKMTYKSAGVDVHAGYDAVSRIKKHVASTHVQGMLGGIGDFGGMFEIPAGYKNPVLICGTDGVGTKLQLAFMSGIHNTIGIDCVAMCANDIICQGAKPLLFLDYIGCGRMDPAQIEQIVEGVAKGCIQAECALSGGETAEMPGFYKDGEYDLAGFCVGIAEKDRLLKKTNVREGNILIGLPSSGVHSNGYSLVRKLFFDKLKDSIDKYYEELAKTLIEELLIPTRIYVSTVMSLLSTCQVRAIAHITGGGFIENIPRILTDDLAACIQRDKVPVKPIFNLIAKLGNVEEKEMFNTFNMGIGLVLAVAEGEAQHVLSRLEMLGENPCVIGSVVKRQEEPIFFV